MLLKQSTLQKLIELKNSLPACDLAGDLVINASGDRHSPLKAARECSIGGGIRVAVDACHRCNQIKQATTEHA